MSYEQNAINAIEVLDRDKWAVQLSVQHIMNVLHDYIPRSCFREAEEELFKALFVNGTELVSNDMRREYEQWKKIHLDTSMLRPLSKV